MRIIYIFFSILILIYSCKKDKESKEDNSLNYVNDTISIALVSFDTSCYTKWINKNQVFSLDSAKYSRIYNNYNLSVKEIWMFKAIREGNDTVKLRHSCICDSNKIDTFYLMPNIIKR